MDIKYKDFQGNAEHDAGFESYDVDDDIEESETEENFNSPDEEELKPRGKVKEKDKWIPDEQLRLLYVYFKDMAVEPLFAAKQEVEISARIKMCEIRMAKVPKSIDTKKYEQEETRPRRVR